MKLAEKFLMESLTSESVVSEIIDEIVEGFQLYISDGKAEQWLVKYLDAEAKRKHQIKAEMQYWPSYAGCSNTNFSVLGYRWENLPDPRSHYYKGFDLGKIAEDVLGSLYVELKNFAENNGFCINRTRATTNISVTYEINIQW